MDAEGLVHWPVMFVYPETMQTDAVEDFHEADSLQQHLDAMFAEDAPPLDWDTEQQYTRSNLELYYLAYAAKPLSLQQLTEVCWSFVCTTLSLLVAGTAICTLPLSKTRIWPLHSVFTMYNNGPV